MSETKENLENFSEMVKRHDLTYEYSDDHRYWVSGERSMDMIKIEALGLPIDSVVEIWNAHVDKKIVEGHRDTFYINEDTVNEWKRSVMRNRS
jgi:hypothetical protein